VSDGRGSPETLCRPVPGGRSAVKNAIWKALCDCFFGRDVRQTDTVVDIGAGYCEFINNVVCRRKIAVDPNPDVRRFASPNVELLNESCMTVSSLPG